MVNFPSSLDALANPSATTYADDAGYELDVVISTLNDIAEALEAKLGPGATTPAADKILVGVAGGASGWDTFIRYNKLINGDMRLAQRAMPTTDNAYALDRWRLLLEAANAATIAQETSDVPTNGSNRACKLTVGSANNNKFGIWQVLEFADIADLRGKSVALQLKMKATAGIGDVRAAVVEFTGAADSVSGDPISAWGAAGTNPTLAAGYAYCSGYTPVSLAPTTAWATYRIQGVSIGTGANNLAVLIWCDDKSTTATTDILRITDVQVEEGLLCSSVARRPFALELALCQRYFQKSWAPATAVGTASPNGAVVFGGSDNNNSKTLYVPVRHRQSMRNVPAVTLWDAAGASGKITTINAAGATTDGVTPTSGSSFANSEGFVMVHTGLVAGALFHYAADAEL